MCLALVAAHIRPILIPTFPNQSPTELRQQLKLDTVDETLTSIRERMWRDLVSGAGHVREVETGEGSLEVMLRCAAAVSGRVTAQSLIAGMKYWQARMEMLVQQMSTHKLLDAPNEHVVTLSDAVAVFDEPVKVALSFRQAAAVLSCRVSK